MIVLNHCGITNAVYYSSRFPQPYRIPLDLESSVQVDYTPVAVNFANFHQAVQFTVDQQKHHRDVHPWQDEYAQINTISHVITVTDKLAGKFSVILDGLSEWRNWAFVYLPTAIYEEAEGAGFAAVETDALRYQQGHDHWPNYRFTGGPYCWRIYYGCNFCGAYSSQSRLWEFRFPMENAVNGCREFYFISTPSARYQECGRVSTSITKPSPAERLGESDIFISCRFDWIKLCCYYHWLTRDDIAWLTDVAPFVPIMGTVGQGLSVPLDVSLYGTTHTNTELPGYKTKALLRKPATLSSYHGISPHWLSHLGFDWVQALSPFQRPDPWASTPPPFPSILPSESRQSGPVDQD